MRPTAPTWNGFILLVTIALASCGNARHTVHEGGFQKRKYQSGWHFDIGGRTERRAAERNSGTKLLPARATHHLATGQKEAPSPLGNDLDPAIITEGADVISAEPTASLDVVVIAPSPRAAAFPPPQIADQEPPTKQFNPWALPAFALALGTIAYGILGTSNIIIVIAVVLTLLVASIALKKGRTNEWTGKGFAVSAMIIGCLSALITVIALLQGGF